MFTIWLVFHVLVCFALVLVVLMQSSKGEGLAGSAFGGSGISGAVFGGRGAASFLSRATTVLAVLFMLNCGALAYMSASNRGIRTGSAAEPTTSESVVTRRAQEERDRAMQQQQQQQALPTDSAAAGDISIDDILGGEETAPRDTSGN